MKLKPNPSTPHVPASLALTLSLALAAGPACGQIRALYDFDAPTSNVATDSSVDADATTTSSDFGQGPGLTGLVSGGSDNYFIRTNGTPSTATLADAIANDCYAGFTLTNSSGGSIDLSQLSFDYYYTTNGPSLSGGVAVLTSLTGFTPGDELGTVTVDSTSSKTATVLLDDPAFTAIPDAAAIEVRLYIWDDSDGSQPIMRLDNVELSTVDPIMILDPAVDPDLSFGTSFAAAPGGLANRTVRYTNTSSINDIEIQSISLTGDGGGVFALVSPPATPFTLNAGAFFEVEVSATSMVGTSGVISGELAIDTDEDTPENPQDKALPISAAFYPPFTLLIDNPTLDSDRSGWVNGAPHITPGPASPGGVRPKGKGDIGGPGTVPDTFSNSIPSGASDFEVTFKFAILDDSVIPNYTGGLAPSGDYLERAMQFVLFGNNGALPSFNTISDSHMANAMINIAYFYDGAFNGGDEGFYLYDGTDWTLLAGLGTIDGSIDGPDGSVDADSDAEGLPISITTASLTANTVTVTTSAPHGYADGNPVEIADLGFSTTDPNGSFSVISVPTPDSFTYALTGPDESYIAGAATATGPPDLGDGLLDPADSNDTVNAYEMRIVGTGFGTVSASYDISISGANTSTPAASVTGLTDFHSLDITDPSATPSGLSFTTGDDSTSSGNGGASTLNGYNTSWWLDEAYVWSAAAPDPLMTVSVADANYDLFDSATSESAVVTVTNGGAINNLTVSGAVASGSGFLIDPAFAMQVLPPGDSLDITVKFDNAVAGLSPGDVVNGNLEITSDADVDPLQAVNFRGSLTDYTELVKGGVFDVLNPATDDRFTGWSDGGVANILQVPGLLPGSANACYLSQGGSFVQNRFEAGASELVADVYFAIKDTLNRQFNLLVNTTNNATAPLNIALNQGILQTFQGAQGGGGGFTNVLIPSPALNFSDDADQNGSLDDAGDTKNVYRLRITCSSWGTPSASYELELFDSSNASLGTSGTLTAFRTDGAQDHLSVPAGILRFTSDNGSSPGFWIDDVSASGSLVIPAGDITITSVTRSGTELTIAFTGDAGSAGSFSVTKSPDLTTAFDPASVLAPGVTEGAAGEYTVKVDVSGDGNRHFYRIEN